MRTESESGRPTYLVGCDMGGWHNRKKDSGDAVAVLRVADGSVQHVEATADVTFFPVLDDGPLARCLDRAIKEDATIVVGIDAALSWPEAFRGLVKTIPQCGATPLFAPTAAIDNPYLYRETDRFVKQHVFEKKNPLTAVGDKFGNNSSKAQVLVQWLLKRMPGAYRPPFDKWDRDKAKAARHSVIEVYPAASMKSTAFRKLKWPMERQSMDQVGNSDVADAKRCAMTGMCYAAHVGIISPEFRCPEVWLPDDVDDAEVAKRRLATEGWIFCPKLNKGK